MLKPLVENLQDVTVSECPAEPKINPNQSTTFFLSYTLMKGQASVYELQHPVAVAV